MQKQKRIKKKKAETFIYMPPENDVMPPSISIKEWKRKMKYGKCSRQGRIHNPKWLRNLTKEQIREYHKKRQAELDAIRREIIKEM